MEPASGKEHRFMVEDLAVTPFFHRHRGHMPATLKLHAEVREEGDNIVLESRIKGYSQEDVIVSASINTIDVTLILERKGEELVKFHNSYFTPKPIEPNKLKIEHKDDILRVIAKKK
jgi:HSP20 family molecular chaperone IbpA